MVNVKAKAPVVVKLLARSIFPASLTVFAALIKSNVSDLPAVNAVEEVAARVTSNAADVSLIPRVVRPVWVPPAIAGAVANTTFPDPVEVVNEVVVLAVPLPVDVKNAGCTNVLPASLERAPGVPVADVYVISPIVVPTFAAKVVVPAGRVALVIPVAVIVVANAPACVTVAAGIVSVPVVVVTVKPLIVLFVKDCDVARSTRVTVPAGIVAFVVFVVVNVNANAPAVVNEEAVVRFPPKSILPLSFTVLAALIKSKVNDLPAVSAVEDVAAIVTSKAADVSLIPNDVSPVCVPPAIAGDVARTTLPDPVLPIQSGATEAEAVTFSRRK